MPGGLGMVFKVLSENQLKCLSCQVQDPFVLIITPTDQCHGHHRFRLFCRNLCSHLVDPAENRSAVLKILAAWVLN
jgi:hypothetical protein